MHPFKLIFLGIFTFLYVSVSAQRGEANTKGRYSIPFRLTSYNNILIKAVLNNRDTVDLMLHTASNDVTLTEEAMVKMKTVKFDGTVEDVKSWGGNSNSSDFSNNNSLIIAHMHWDSVTIWKDKNSGQESDGKFGLNIFENKVLEFDFDKNILTVTPKIPKRIKDYGKFKLSVKNGSMFIKAVCQTDKDSFANDFLVHSGYGGDVLLDDKFIRENNIGQQIQITGEKKLQDAYGNVLITKRGILPFFKIGELELANVPVGFFEGAIGRQQISVVGGDVLKRFNWIIDAKREYIYLKPNTLFYTNFANI